MILNLKATGTTLTPELRAYVDKKLASLGKLVGGDDDALMTQVEIGKISKHHRKGDIFRAEINVHLGKQHLRAEHEDSDLYAAIDLARDEILREVKSFKSKQQAKTKTGGRKVKKLSRE